MLEINTSELKNIIDSLNSLINEYELIQLNIFNQLKNCTINWQDGNSLVFDDKIYLDKQESKRILELLNEKKELYDYIYRSYSDIGKKIRFNLNGKNAIIYAIDDCCNKATSIINEFYNINRSFYYSEQNSIFYQKDRIIGVRNQLSEIKNSIIKLYDRIEVIEREIKNKITKLEKIKINDFDFNLIK